MKAYKNAQTVSFMNRFLAGGLGYDGAEPWADTANRIAKHVKLRGLPRGARREAFLRICGGGDCFGVFDLGGAVEFHELQRLRIPGNDTESHGDQGHREPSIAGRQAFPAHATLAARSGVVLVVEPDGTKHVIQFGEVGDEHRCCKNPRRGLEAFLLSGVAVLDAHASADNWARDAARSQKLRQAARNLAYLSFQAGRRVDGEISRDVVATFAAILSGSGYES